MEEINNNDKKVDLLEYSTFSVKKLKNLSQLDYYTKGNLNKNCTSSNKKNINKKVTYFKGNKNTYKVVDITENIKSNHTNDQISKNDNREINKTKEPSRLEKLFFTEKEGLIDIDDEYKDKEDKENNINSPTPSMHSTINYENYQCVNNCIITIDEEM
jgi:hypothetical protein